MLRREFHGQVDIAYEGVGGALQRAAWDALAPGGRLMVVGYISEYPHNEGGEPSSGAAPGPLPPSAELFWGGKVVEADGKVAYGSVWPQNRQDTLEAKKELFDLHGSGRIEAWVDGQEFRGVESIPEAVDYMLKGRAVGKVVVELSQPNA